MEDKLHSMMGLATRAGKLAHGDSAVQEAVLKGRARLVIIAGNCGESTAEKIRRLCEEKNVLCTVFSDKESIGKAVGRDEKAVVAFTEEGFAKAAIRLMKKAAE